MAPPPSPKDGEHAEEAKCNGDVTDDAADLEKEECRPIELCVDQAAWLLAAAAPTADTDDSAGCNASAKDLAPAKMGCQGEQEEDEANRRSLALQRLVEVANHEPSQAKRQLFLVVRCHRCLQHTRGGEKHSYQISLPKKQWQWLEAVRQRSKHPTVGKTLRIVIDFYRPICHKDSDFDRAIFGAVRKRLAAATAGREENRAGEEVSENAAPVES